MSELLTLDFVCAKHDKPFSYTLDKPNAATTYRLLGVDLLPPTYANQTLQRDPTPNRYRVLTSATVDPSEIDFSGFKCPWCETESYSGFRFVSCGKCGQKVCMGASRNDAFHCLDHCGCWHLIKTLVPTVDPYEGQTSRVMPLHHSSAAIVQDDVAARPDKPSHAPSLPPPEFRKETIALPSRKALVKTAKRLGRSS